MISLLPFDLVESKPGLNPNEYTIHKADGDKFGLTIIPNNVHYLVNPDPLADAKDVRNIKVPVPAIELGRSIINDYVSSLLGAAPPDSVPGLLTVPGDYTERKEVSTKYMKELMVLRASQNSWFRNLVEMADDTWSKTRSPIGISDLQRSACRMLDYKRDWLNPLPSEQIEKCPYCQSAINAGAVKCITCHEILDKKRYNELVGAK
jgi:hypothetical protein